MSSVSCSDGPNGLMKKFPTQGDLPVFPYVGGVPAIAGWNSPSVSPLSSSVLPPFSLSLPPDTQKTQKQKMIC